MQRLTEEQWQVLTLYGKVLENLASSLDSLRGDIEEESISIEEESISIEVKEYEDIADVAELALSAAERLNNIVPDSIRFSDNKEFKEKYFELVTALGKLHVTKDIHFKYKYLL